MPVHWCVPLAIKAQKPCRMEIARARWGFRLIPGTRRSKPEQNEFATALSRSAVSLIYVQYPSPPRSSRLEPTRRRNIEMAKTGGQSLLSVWTRTHGAWAALQAFWIPPRNVSKRKNGGFLLYVGPCLRSCLSQFIPLAQGKKRKLQPIKRCSYIRSRDAFSPRSCVSQPTLPVYVGVLRERRHSFRRQCVAGCKREGEWDETTERERDGRDERRMSRRRLSKLPFSPKLPFLSPVLNSLSSPALLASCLSCFAWFSCVYLTMVPTRKGRQYNLMCPSDRRQIVYFGQTAVDCTFISFLNSITLQKLTKKYCEKNW